MLLIRKCLPWRLAFLLGAVSSLCGGFAVDGFMTPCGRRNFRSSLFAVTNGKQDNNDNNNDNNSKRSKHTLYDVLQVPRDATAAEMKQKYRSLARLTHPDAIRQNMVQSDPRHAKNSSAQFSDIVRAYKTLSNRRDRLRYDRELKAGEIIESVENAADEAIRATRSAAPKVKEAVESALPFLRKDQVADADNDAAAAALQRQQQEEQERLKQQQLEQEQQRQQQKQQEQFQRWQQQQQEEEEERQRKQKQEEQFRLWQQQQEEERQRQEQQKRKQQEQYEQYRQWQKQQQLQQLQQQQQEQERQRQQQEQERERQRQQQEQYEQYRQWQQQQQQQQLLQQQQQQYESAEGTEGVVSDASSNKDIIDSDTNINSNKNNSNDDDDDNQKEKEKSVDFGDAIMSTLRPGQEEKKPIDRTGLQEEASKLQQRAEVELGKMEGVQSELAQVIEKRLKLGTRVPGTKLTAGEAQYIADLLREDASETGYTDRLGLEYTVGFEIKEYRNMEAEYEDKAAIASKIAAYTEEVVEKIMGGAVVEESSGRELLQVLADMETRDRRIQEELSRSRQMLEMRREGVRMLLRRKEQTIEDEVNFRNGGKRAAATEMAAGEDAKVIFAPTEKERKDFEVLEKRERELADQIVKLEESIDRLLSKAVEFRRKAMGNDQISIGALESIGEL